MHVFGEGSEIFFGAGTTGWSSSARDQRKRILGDWLAYSSGAVVVVVCFVCVIDGAGWSSRRG